MNLSQAIAAKDFVIIAEMETPKGVDIAGFVEAARRLKGRINAVLVPDMGHAVMRLSALAGAVVLAGQGLNPIVQFNCRDRNRLALQGDLLGAHVLGIENVMAVAGEPAHLGDHVDAKGVNDLTQAGFLQAAKALMEGHDLAGKPLQGAPRLCPGARIEPWQDSAQARVRAAEAREAVDAGAQFLVTPPVFNSAALEDFLSTAGDLGAPVIASVLLLKSVGMARYLNQNLPGITVGEDQIKRIRAASDRPAECVKIAAETVRSLEGVCAGALLVTAGWEQRLGEILDHAGR